MVALLRVAATAPSSELRCRAREFQDWAEPAPAVIEASTPVKEASRVAAVGALWGAAMAVAADQVGAATQTARTAAAVILLDVIVT